MFAFTITYQSISNPKKKTVMKTLIFSFAFFAIAASANAQTTTQSVSQVVTLNLQNQIDIAITNPTGTSFTFGSAANYASGLTNVNASLFTVRSNKAWNVTVNAGAANFTSGAATTMPASVLGVRLTGVGNYSNLSTTAANLTSGSRGLGTFAIDYQANPGFNYDSGTYTLNVVYTATQQ